jgi:hypothetical protein
MTLEQIKDDIVRRSKSSARVEFGSLRKSIRGYVIGKRDPRIEFHELAYGGSKGQGREVGYRDKYRGRAVRTSYGMNSLLEENVRELVKTNPDVKWKLIREDPRSGKQWVIEYNGNGKQPEGTGNLVDKTLKASDSTQADKAYNERTNSGNVNDYLNSLRRRNGTR